jgi:hypothetical protein
MSSYPDHPTFPSPHKKRKATQHFSAWSGPIATVAAEPFSAGVVSFRRSTCRAAVVLDRKQLVDLISQLELLAREARAELLACGFDSCEEFFDAGAALCGAPDRDDNFPAVFDDRDPGYPSVFDVPAARARLDVEVSGGSAQLFWLRFTVPASAAEVAIDARFFLTGPEAAHLASQLRALLGAEQPALSATVICPF